MKKRLLSLLMTFVMVIGLLPAQARAAEAELTQDEDGVYLIGTKEELEAFRDKVNGGDRAICARLTGDIDLGGEEWTPIGGATGYATTYYGGEFDGNGKTIANFTITAAYNHAGFFSYVKEATASIHDLNITGARITSTKNNVGGIVGTIIDGRIERCSFDGSVTSTASNGYAGGIAGYLGNSKTTSPTIRECANFGAISAKYAGGITGYAKFSKSIESCYNTGTVTGSFRSGGIVGQNMNGTNVSSCYNIGEITGAGTAGAISGFNGVAIENCYWTKPDNVQGGGSGTVSGCEKVSSSEGLADKLSAAFVEDVKGINGGYPVLAWQTEGAAPAPKNPRVEITGDKTLNQTNDNRKQSGVLEAEQIDVDQKEIVTWSVISGDDVVALETPEGVDEYNSTVILKELQPGRAQIKAQAGVYEVTADVRVVPYITALQLDGTPAAGEKYRVTVYIYGGGVYDEAKFGELTGFEWSYYDSYSDKRGETAIQGGGMEITVPEGTEGKELSVKLYAHGEYLIPNAIGGYYKKIADKASAVLANDKQALRIPTEEIKASGALRLPQTGEHGSVITWESNAPEIISSAGTVTLPDNGKSVVTLTATLSYGGKTERKSFSITVWSQAAQDAVTDREKLEEALNQLGSFYKLYPVYGQDENVLDMLRGDLEAKGITDVSAAIKTVTPTNATVQQPCSAISDEGAITYFYDDPNSAERLQWCGTFDVTFTLSRNTASEDLTIPAVVCWNADRVRETMTKEILNQVVLPERTEADLELPKVLADKRWVQISWKSSNDSVISVSTERQDEADHLFDAYLGKITRQKLDETVTLTATFTFQRTNDIAGVEEAIVMTKVFHVTVKGDANAVERAELYQEKLDRAFETVGVRDYVTGERLLAANGAYTAVHDLQLPTTRDMGIDGKYTPVVIVSGSTEWAEASTTANAARVWISRPLPGQPAETVKLTVQILDRPDGQTGDLSALTILASRELTVAVQPLTQGEIDAEIDLMEQVKTHYWDGIRGSNTEKDDVTANMHAFQECYRDEQGDLTWVYDQNDRKNCGIVPVPLDGWYDQQIWRLFRSSNAEVVAHENLLVTRFTESKAVTVTSYLSSETLGKYAEKYPENADLQKLYKQPVTVQLVITGEKYEHETEISARKDAAQLALASRPVLTVSFTLTGRGGMGFREENLRYAEGSTVYDVFSDLLAAHGYTCNRRGSYIAAITSDSGITLEEFDEGGNSGWMYRVNGELVGKYMSSQNLRDGDSIEVFFTSDWTKEPGSGRWSAASTADREAAGKVSGLIDAIGKVTQESAEAIQAARKAYDALSAAQKKLVEGYDTLLAAEKELAALRSGALPFADVKLGAWYTDAVKFVYANGLMTGVSNDRFAPDDTATRAQIVQILYRLAGSPDAPRADCPDVKDGAWYADAVAWACELGIVNGYEDGRFGPNDTVTREQLAAILYRYSLKQGTDVTQSGELAGFRDTEEISAWASDALRWAVGNGLVKGTDQSMLAPRDTATRAQISAIFWRLCA